MTVQGEKQKAVPGRNENVRPEEAFVLEPSYSRLPNSFLAAAPLPPPQGTPNSVMREMLTDRQIPEAEDEADRLSAGIRYGTPNSVRQQMGHRLGADFSSVRFHSNSESIRRNESLGARAYTRGADVFFGRGGFDPSIAAHELVHTVQQRAVPGHVSQSVSFGAVQMKKKFWAGKLVDQVKASESPEPEEEQKRNIAAHGRPVKVSLWQRFRSFLHRHNPFTKRGTAGAGHQISDDAALKADSPADPSLLSAEPPAGSPSPAPEAGHDEIPAPPSGSSSPAPEAGHDEIPAPPSGSPSPAPEAGHDEIPAPPSGSPSPAPEAGHDESPAPPSGSPSPAPGPEHAESPAPPSGSPSPASGPEHDESPAPPSGSPSPAPDAEHDESPAPPSRSSSPESEPERAVIPETESSEEEEEEEEIVPVRPEAVTAEEEGPHAEEEDYDSDAVTDQQIREYINAHNEVHPNRQIRRAVRGRAGSGFKKKAKLAAEVIGAGGQIASLANNTDRLIDLAGGGFGGLGAKTQSADYEMKEGPVLGGAASLMGAGAAAISTVTNAADTIENAKNIREGLSPADMLESAGSTAASAAALGSSGIQFLDTAGAAVSPALDAVPFLQIATGGFNGIVGFGRGIRNGVALHRVRKEQRALTRKMERDAAPAAADPESEEGPMLISAEDPIPADGYVAGEASPEPAEIPAAGDEGPDRADNAETPAQKLARRQRMLRTFRQAEAVAERKRTAGIVQGVQGSVTAGAGLASVLTGPLMPAVSAAVGGTSAGMALGRLAYEKIRKKELRERVIAEDLNINWKEEEELVRQRVTGGASLSSRQVRTIILKAHGFEKGTRHEAFSLLTQDRADFLVNQAESSSEEALMADRVISALGINRKNGRYTDAAKKFLAQKLT